MNKYKISHIFGFLFFFSITFTSHASKLNENNYLNVGCLSNNDGSKLSCEIFSRNSKSQLVNVSSVLPGDDTNLMNKRFIGRVINLRPDFRSTFFKATQYASIQFTTKINSDGNTLHSILKSNVVGSPSYLGDIIAFLVKGSNKEINNQLTDEEFISKVKENESNNVPSVYSFGNYTLSFFANQNLNSGLKSSIYP